MMNNFVKQKMSYKAAGGLLISEQIASYIYSLLCPVAKSIINKEKKQEI